MNRTVVLSILLRNFLLHKATTTRVGHQFSDSAENMAVMSRYDASTLSLPTNPASAVSPLDIASPVLTTRTQPNDKNHQPKHAVPSASAGRRSHGSAERPGKKPTQNVGSFGQNYDKDLERRILQDPVRKTGFDPQSQLMRDLFLNYDRRVRPVRNFNTTVNITLTMTLYQLIQVNEPEEHVIINIWMAHTWHDEFLAWNPADYDNIQYLVIPWDNVWLSDIVLYNGLDMDINKSEKRINIELTMNPNDPTRAQVRFAFPAIYRFNCKLDVYYFPFDRQNCTMLFGSWVYDGRLVNLHPQSSTVKMDNFIQNQEWNVASFDAVRHQLKYSCCPQPYVNIQYHLVLERKPLLFVCNYVVPTVIVALISLLGFFTPGNTTSERKEKVTLGINTLLAMSILLLMVSDRMPTAGNYIPIMAFFFLAIIVLEAMAISLTVVVILLQRRGRHGEQPNAFVRKIFVDLLAQLLWVESVEIQPDVPGSARQKTKKVPVPTLSFCADECGEIVTYRGEAPSNGNELQTDFSQSTSAFVCRISQWETVADVVERLFLIVFLTLLASLSIGILFYAIANLK